MQTKRYSTLSEYELKTEIAQLREKARKAEQMGMINEFAVLDRKITMAQAYLLNPDDYLPGEIYEINEALGTYFKIEYMNGVFAWGHRLESPNEEEGLPISMLGQKKEKNESH